VTTYDYGYISDALDLATILVTVHLWSCSDCGNLVRTLGQTCQSAVNETGYGEQGKSLSGSPIKAWRDGRAVYCTGLENPEFLSGKLLFLEGLRIEPYRNAQIIFKMWQLRGN
jgi:hypothetical protein